MLSALRAGFRSLARNWGLVVLVLLVELHDADLGGGVLAAERLLAKRVLHHRGEQVPPDGNVAAHVDAAGIDALDDRGEAAPEVVAGLAKRLERARLPVPRAGGTG